MRPLIGITARAERVSQFLPLPLYAITQNYARAVWEAGGMPLLLPPLFGAAEAGSLLARLDGLVLSGGGDVAAERYRAANNPSIQLVDHDRDRAEIALVETALQQGKPLLGICRGIQVLNVTLGGTLYADIASEVPGALPHRPAEGAPLDSAAHPLQLAPASRLAAVLAGETAVVNSFHHQAARAVGDGLIATAWASDGVIEGLEKPDHPFCIGVQWHPETGFGNQAGMERLFRALVLAATPST
ncbi:MAG: gamma-glutamyl-gamma-aminobutyrate hydrolase family protein [Anaerolineae bacterium]|nr:gamma-glutamyl-gamma-aminobutyrate hydrolase family protein [Anaerolineae bacterium]